MPDRASRPRRRGLTVLIGAAVVAGLAVSVTSPALAVEDAPSRTIAMTPELRDRIQTMVDEFRHRYGITGLSAAVVTPDPAGSGAVTTMFVSGKLAEHTSTPVDSSTIFELGSETKVFTADLLKYLVESGRVSLEDHVQEYAPSGVTVPSWTDPNTGEVTHLTLRDLATHQAALHDDPPNFDQGCTGIPNCINPHPGYTQTLLWDAFSSYHLPWKPGTKWLYSDWGFGLLGTILANVVEAVPMPDPPKFQSALEGAFLNDLGMSSTVIEEGHSGNFATPYSVAGAPTYYWDNTNALAGGGGLVSNADDMATFIAAHLGYVSSDAPLGVRAMAETLHPVSTITTACSIPTECKDADFAMGLGWQLFHAAPASEQGIHVPWAFKNGGTAGFSTDTFLAPSEGVGVTTMFNKKREKQPNGSGDEVAGQILALLVDSRTPVLADTGAEVSGAGLAAGALIVAFGSALVVRQRMQRQQRVS